MGERVFATARGEVISSMGPKKPSKGGDNRDAGTGRFVTEKYAKKHPGTTIHESGKKKGK